MRSAVYRGELIHARYGEVPDRYRYPLYFASFDVDELPELDRRLRLFGHNRLSPLALYDRDYQGAGTGLRTAVEGLTRRANLRQRFARIELVTQPRVLGYAFNPVSFFLCRDASERLACAVAEVSNTYGGRHRYLLGDAERITGPGDGFRTQKQLYVSPYMDRAATYHWWFRDDGDRRTVAMDVLDRQGARFFRAVMTGRRQPLTDGTIGRLLLRYPLMTAQIISLIHWRAFLLRRRGVVHTPPPARDTAPC